jgi:Ca-activated chloride channel homolog
MKFRHILLSLIICFSWCLLGFTWGDLLARNTKKGNNLFDTGQYDEALQAYTEADVNSKTGDPRLPKLYNNMGNTLYQQGKYDQAVAMYQKALEASHDNRFKADVQYNAGNVWFKQRDYQKALESYKQALKLNPKHPQAKQNKELVEKLIVKPPPQQQQQQQDQENKEKNKEQQNQQQQQSQDQEQNQQEEEQKTQPEKQQQPQEQEQQAAKKPENPEDREKQLSKEEALRILDALKEKEKLQQQKFQSLPRPVEKDW